MSDSTVWQKMKFRRSDMSWRYNPFQFPIINEILNTREHKLFKNLDDFSKSVILLSVHIMLADGIIHPRETELLRNKLSKIFPAIKLADLDYLLKNYFYKFRQSADSYIFENSANTIPVYINRETKDKAVKNNLCYFLCEIALGDANFKKSEKLLLLKVCRDLGLTDMDIARLFAFFEGRITDINFSTRHRWEKQEKETKSRARTTRAKQKTSQPAFNYSLYRYHSALIILGVTKNTSANQIKRTYKKLAMQYHPDRFVNVPEVEKQHSTAMFIKIQEAYELVKKVKRFT